QVANEIRIDDRNYIGPQPGTAVTPHDIRILGYGLRATFNQQTEVHATLCAPRARAHLGSDLILEGQLAADSIGLEARVVAGPSGSLGITTTTTSTIPPLCGNH